MRDIISSTQVNFEKMKRELSDKDRAIEEKNQEILRLKIDLEEAIQPNARQMRASVNEQDRRSVVLELRLVVERLQAELKKCKQQMIKDRPVSSAGSTIEYNKPNPHNTLGSEDQLLKEL